MDSIVPSLKSMYFESSTHRTWPSLCVPSVATPSARNQGDEPALRLMVIDSSQGGCGDLRVLNPHWTVSIVAAALAIRIEEMSASLLNPLLCPFSLWQCGI